MQFGMMDGFRPKSSVNVEVQGIPMHATEDRNGQIAYHLSGFGRFHQRAMLRLSCWFRCRATTRSDFGALSRAILWDVEQTVLVDTGWSHEWFSKQSSRLLSRRQHMRGVRL